MLKKIVSAAMLVAAMMSAGACAGPRYSAGFGVRYGPPPPPRYGIVGYAPGPGYVWTDGYWNRGPRGWNWAAGSWRRPPRPRAMWVPGRWEQWHGDYRFRQGYWR
jgi:hypothetical protein